MPAPSIRATTGPVAGTSSSFTPTLPTHQAGDILIVAVANHNASQDVTTATSGWAELADVTTVDTSSTGVRLFVWWKRATSASETNPSFTGGATGYVYTIWSVQDCPPSGDPFDDWDFVIQEHGVSADLTLPAVAGTTPDTFALYVVGDSRDSASTTTFSSWTNGNLTGLAEIADFGSVAGAGVCFGAATGTAGASGSIGTGSVTSATSTAKVGVTILFKNVGVTVTPGVGAITVAGYPPTVTTASTSPEVTPGVGAITVTGYAPTVVVDRTLTPSVGAITVTGYPPTISIDLELTPGVGAVQVTGYPPTVVAADRFIPRIMVI